MHPNWIAIALYSLATPNGWLSRTSNSSWSTPTLSSATARAGVHVRALILYMIPGTTTS